MANVDAAFGFVPVRHMSGNAPRTNKYTIASGLAENIFTGDLVILINTGLLLHILQQKPIILASLLGFLIPHQMAHTFIVSIGLRVLLLQTSWHMCMMIHTLCLKFSRQEPLLRPILAIVLMLLLALVQP